MSRNNRPKRREASTGKAGPDEARNYERDTTMDMSRRTRKIASAGILGVAFAAAAYTASTVVAAHAQPAAGCQGVAQPVYDDNTYQLVGTWEVTLPVGGEVILPDQDVATCTAHGLEIDQP